MRATRPTNTKLVFQAPALDDRLGAWGQSPDRLSSGRLLGCRTFVTAAFEYAQLLFSLPPAA